MNEASTLESPKGRGRLSQILSLVYKTPLEREREFYRRLRELNETIAGAPDSMTHLVLRGELYLERGENERARADFEKALARAEKLDAARGWLIVEQVMRDRALYGLRVVEQRH